MCVFVSGCANNMYEGLKPRWQDQLNESKISFRGLCEVDKKVVWASGSGGSFARTTDGGGYWQVGKIPGAENIDFRDIEAFNENTAIVFGIESPAKFYKTADGGRTWKLVYENDTKGIFFSAAHFPNPKEGFALSDPVDGKFFIVQTRDGGDTWTMLNEQSFPVAIEGEGIFAASGTNITTTDDKKIIFVTGCTAARIFSSIDAGKSWSYVDSPFKSGAGSDGIFSIAMKDKRQGIIVGGDYTKEDTAETNAAITADGGKSWKLIEKNKPSGFRECVKYLGGSDTVITVGPNGSDISYDGGKNFEKFAPYMGLHTLAVSLDGKSVWAAGRNGLIVKLVWPDLD